MLACCERAGKLMPNLNLSRQVFFRSELCLPSLKQARHKDWPMGKTAPSSGLLLQHDSKDQPRNQVFSCNVGILHVGFLPGRFYLVE